MVTTNELTRHHIAASCLARYGLTIETAVTENGILVVHGRVGTSRTVAADCPDDRLNAPETPRHLRALYEHAYATHSRFVLIAEPGSADAAQSLLDETVRASVLIATPQFH